jgi:putative endonuclease
MPYYVYILTNRTRSALYVGMTRELLSRVKQHRGKKVAGFIRRYNIDSLVYFEVFDTAYEAITREKQLKAGSRKRKMQLVDGFNPKWNDLYIEPAGDDQGSLRVDL